jgi:outer membrane protein assembly factor BamB
MSNRSLVFWGVLLASIGGVCAPLSAAVTPRIVENRPAVLTAPRTTTKTDWPQSGYDAAHDGYNPFERVINLSNVGSLQLAWSFSTGSSNPAGNVVEANDILYAASADGTLFALDTATGSELWSFPTGSGYGTSGATPAVDRGVVFSVCNVASGNQGICAINAKTGALKWSYAVSGATTFAETPPVLDNDYVYFGACGTTCGYWGLWEKNGLPTYYATEPGGCALNNGIVPTIAQGTVFTSIGCTNSTLMALPEKRLESPGWQQSVTGLVGGISFADFFVFATSPSPGAQQLYAYDSESGAPQWQVSESASTSTIGTVGSAYHSAYAPLAGNLDDFRPAGAKGSPRLRQSCACDTPSVAAANHILYILNAGLAQAIDASDFSALWTASGTPSVGSPIVVDGAVYGACNGTNVCAWTLPGSLGRRR